VAAAAFAPFISAVHPAIFGLDEFAELEQPLGLSKTFQQLDYLNIKSPVDGQLGLLDAEIGQTINRNQRIGQINVLSSLKVEVEIDEGAEFALGGEEMLAQIRVLGDEIAQRLANSLCGYFDNGLLCGVGPKRRGNQDFDGHIFLSKRF